MSRISTNAWRGAGLALATALGLAAPAGAFAALGGDEASVLRDQQALGATRGVSEGPLYTLHEVRTADGVELHEFVNSSGVVFAVSWRGPRMPDPDVLAGAASDRYFAAARRQPRNHHVVTLNEPDLRVSVIRLQRGWLGHALLPAALPLGVDARDLR